MSLPFVAVSTLRRGKGHISSPLARWNGEAVLAWHRAHGGGATLIRTDFDPSNPAAASGWLAVVDDELLGDAAHSKPDTQLAELRSQTAGRMRAAEHKNVTAPSVALLDRDGTTIVDRHYLADPDGVELLPGAAEGLRLLKETGVKLALVTNQSGIASGRFTPDTLAAVHRRLAALLESEGVRLDGIYSCPHAVEDNCPCRKPRTGLALQAAADLGVNLSGAFVVGDKAADIGLARALGVPAVLVTTGEGSSTLSSDADRADYVVDDLATLGRFWFHPAGLLHPIPLPG